MHIHTKKLCLVLLALSCSLHGNPPTSKNLFYGETTSNFIIGWQFKDHCDHIYNPRDPRPNCGIDVIPEDVKAGDTIFVTSIDSFIASMHEEIKYPYIIVTHGDFRDTCHDRHLAYLDDEKIIARFSVHPPKSQHKKFFPLPLGIAIDRENYENKEELNAYFSELRETSPKSKLLYLNFPSFQNNDRKKAKSILKKKGFPFSKRAPFKEYLKEMASHKFALSPRGHGPDCYRTWEALLVGTIPIVRRCQFDKVLLRSHENERYTGSQLDRLYEDLPVLVIDDWEEITEEFLNKKYEEITSKSYDIRKLYAEYWLDKIQSVRTNFLSQYEASKAD